MEIKKTLMIEYQNQNFIFQATSFPEFPAPKEVLLKDIHYSHQIFI